MAYIIECRINARERIYRVSDEGAKDIDDIQKKKSKGLWPSNLCTIQGEKVPVDSIEIISPELTWWEHDTRALASRSKTRCQHCFTVHGYGESCDCAKARLTRTGLINQEHQAAGKLLSPEQVRAGMSLAISIALLYPSVTLQSPIVANYLRRTGIKPWELPEPTFAQTAAVSARADGRTKTLQEWRALIEPPKPTPIAEPDAQNDAAMRSEGVDAPQVSTEAISDAPAPVYDVTDEDEPGMHPMEEDREKMLAEIPF